MFLLTKHLTKNRFLGVTTFPVKAKTTGGSYVIPKRTTTVAQDIHRG
jgi:hypothetical protein